MTGLYPFFQDLPRQDLHAQEFVPYLLWIPTPGPTRPVKLCASFDGWTPQNMTGAQEPGQRSRIPSSMDGLSSTGQASRSQTQDIAPCFPKAGLCNATQALGDRLVKLCLTLLRLASPRLAKHCGARKCKLCPLHHDTPPQG